MTNDEMTATPLAGYFGVDTTLPAELSVIATGNDAYVLETPRGFITAFNRILIFTDLHTAYKIARQHDRTGGVTFWKGTRASWRQSAKEAGVPILFVKGDVDG